MLANATAFQARFTRGDSPQRRALTLCDLNRFAGAYEPLGRDRAAQVLCNGFIFWQRVLGRSRPPPAFHPLQRRGLGFEVDGNLDELAPNRVLPRFVIVFR
jgi:hypothetical protein